MLTVALYLRYICRFNIVNFVISLACSLYFGFKFNLLHDLRTCPDCFGNELCPFINNGQIRLSFPSYTATLVNPRLTKSVFYGTVNDTDWIVLKRKFRGRRKFSPTRKWNLKNQHSSVEFQNVGNVILCPGFRDFSWFYRSIGESLKGRNLWLDIENSIEPLLLRTLENWPFPKYLGSCGDIIGVEYKGHPLTEFISQDIRTRLFLAAELLRMAQIATLKNAEFIFYFTDVSHDNLVVDSNGSVSLVDLDNIIMVDKRNYPASIKHTIHQSEILQEYEYAFSPSDICQHYLSDHNYYTICVHILANEKNGLLMNIPRELSKEYPDLIYLMNECIRPKTFANRILAGDELLKFLEIMNQNFNFSRTI